MVTDEILTVDRVIIDGCETYATCPHCKQVVTLPDGQVRGEQFHHKNRGGCDGWFEVSSDASHMRLRS